VGLGFEQLLLSGFGSGSPTGNNGVGFRVPEGVLRSRGSVVLAEDYEVVFLKVQLKLLVREGLIATHRSFRPRVQVSGTQRKRIQIPYLSV
jgi:hypothetical protein